MVFSKMNQRKSGISKPWLLRTFLALQLLVTFTVSPALAGESVEPSVSTESKQFDCCKDTELEKKSEKSSDDKDKKSDEVASLDAKSDAAESATDTETVTTIDNDAASDEDAKASETAMEESSKVTELSDKSEVETDKSSAETSSEEKKNVSTSSTSEESKTEVSTSDAQATPEAKPEDKKASASSEEALEVADNEAVSEESKLEETADTETKKIADATVEEESAANESKEAIVEEEDELAFLKEGFVEKEDFNVIYIDNDEKEIVEETIAYEELPTDDAKTRIKAGSKFPVVMVSNISSKTAKKGDVLQARLKYDLKIGPKMIAKKGCLVTGHIDYNMKARTVLHSMVSPKRWYRNSGCIGIMFDEIINGKGEHIALNARPARKDRIVKNKAEGRLLGVNHAGQITGPWGQQLKYKAVRVGLNAALAPAGVFSFGAMPVALGVMGAVNPSFAFMKPVGTNVPHRRIKGFCWGFLSGIPGSWIIEDTVTKGQEALVRPGDEFLVELHQEFTGKVLTEAQLLPGASGKVAGDVDDKRLEKTKKRGIFKFKSKKPASEKTTTKK